MPYGAVLVTLGDHGAVVVTPRRDEGEVAARFLEEVGRRPRPRR